jgi:transcription-repair coupling factor (superfamily II helicase)
VPRKKSPATDQFQVRFSESKLVAALQAELSLEGGVTRADFASSAWAFLAALIHRVEPGAPILMVIPGLKQQEALYQDLQTWLVWLASSSKGNSKEKSKDREESDGLILPEFFPAWETLPHEAKLSHADVISERLETLLAFQGFDPLKNGEAPVTVTNVVALLQKTFPPAEFQRRLKTIKIGQDLDPLDLVEWLESQAYEPEAKVTQKGDLALRGGIVDVFPLASPWPVRIEFFGNEVDSIRYFDPQTQMSLEKIESVVLSPAGEFGVLLRDIDQAPEGEAGAQVASLIDYLPASTVFIVCDPSTIEEFSETYLSQIPDEDPFSQEWADVIEQAEKKSFRIFNWSSQIDEELVAPVDLDTGKLVGNEAETKGTPFPVFEDLEQYRPLDVRAPVLQVAEQQRQQFFEQMHRWLRQGYRLDVFCNNEGERDRFAEIWSELGWAEASYDGLLGMEIGMLGRGFHVESDKWAVVTDAEIFGRYKVQRPRRLKSKHAVAVKSALEIDFSDLIEGDFVVHLQHGIGRFIGLQQLDPVGRSADGKESEGVKSGPECLVIEYAPKDPKQTAPRLYVPVTEAHLVSKYVGAGKANPQLNALGGTRWIKAKAQAEKAVVDLAGEMLTIQAARDSEEGHSFTVDTNWQREFEGAFLYEETVDQVTAIDHTKTDMESDKPMDRLICGDVGFGKTEVAIRAAFKAVMGGKQVAMLVPTTILAQQHYKNLAERMVDYPIRVELISRFQTKKDASSILEAVANGAVDIIIGTHRLVQDDVIFKDLGLVIIDEEQRFGVVHKDKFKHLRKLVDVLTLSATPIPRTLHMALIGARDMSTIETPPHDRLPVETIVTAYDERTIRDAIQRELNREGQVYFLHNRVMTIDTVAEKIRTLVPSARVVVGHGQMDSKALEKVMRTFVNGEADVLVSTTIIESGLDIPNANTILIDRADRFGLSDLYQLRGRVGRYKHQAYAYLMIPRHAGLLSDARKRITAMKQYSRLGSGFKIAMRDLEIRGAGNMLGPQQSGHITAVGFELYCQLLKQSVAALKGETVKPRVEVHVKFDFLSLNPGEETNARLPKKERKAKPKLKFDIRVPREDVALYVEEDEPEVEPVEEEVTQRHPASIPYSYVTEVQQRIEIYRKLAQINDQESLAALKSELRDRFGPMPPAVELLILVADIKWLASDRGVSGVETKKGKLMLTRNRDFVMVGGRFPRLTKKRPEAQLKEVKRLLLSL